MNCDRAGPLTFETAQLRGRLAAGAVQDGGPDANEIDPPQECLSLLRDRVRLLVRHVPAVSKAQYRAPKFGADQRATHQPVALVR